jgi:hypothetical protein
MSPGTSIGPSHVKNGLLSGMPERPTKRSKSLIYSVAMKRSMDASMRAGSQLPTMI